MFVLGIPSKQSVYLLTSPSSCCSTHCPPTHLLTLQPPIYSPSIHPSTHPPATHLLTLHPSSTRPPSIHLLALHPSIYSPSIHPSTRPPSTHKLTVHPPTHHIQESHLITSTGNNQTACLCHSPKGGDRCSPRGNDVNEL